MKNLRAILFPHASLPEEMLKQALSFFGPLKICRPWALDRPVSFAEEGPIRILHPPFELKPLIDVGKLLAEYRTWIRVNQKGGLDALLAFSHERPEKGEAVWAIRRSLRSNPPPDGVPLQENVLKWNLMLHLSQEAEDQEREADRLLKDLRKRSSPLKDLLQESGDPGHPLEDLPHFDPKASWGMVGQVLESWISLFEGHVEAADFLLTFSEKTFQYLGESWEEKGNESRPITMQVRSPDFSALSLPEMAEAKSRFFQSEEGAALRDTVAAFQEGVPPGSGVKESRSRSLSGKGMNIILRRYPRIPFSNSPVSRFSGRTVAFLREELPHDG